MIALNIKNKPQGGSTFPELTKGTPIPHRSVLLGLLMTRILLALPASNSTAQTERSADFIHQLDQDVPRILRSYDMPGTALALVKDGEVVWARGYGMADAAVAKPVTNDTVFLAASISKAWAITTMLVLVSALNFVGGSSWELLLGTFALFFALLCALVAVLESSSACSDEIVGNDPSKRKE